MTLTKVHIVEAIFFPVVMYGWERWTVKKVECQRMYAFELWCWRRLLKVPWTVRRSTLNIHWKDWCWSSSILVIWCEQTTPWKVPDAGKDSEQNEKKASEDEMAGWRHWCNGHELGQTLGVWKGQGGLVWCGHEGAQSQKCWLTEQQQCHGYSLFII